MSYESYVRALRDGVVEGARRRRRYERRRTIALTVTPVVLLFALFGGLIARDTDDAATVRTDEGTRTTEPSAAEEACAVWGELATGDVGQQELRAMRDRFVSLANASGEPILVDAAARMAEPSDVVPYVGFAMEACQQLGLLPAQITSTTVRAPGVLTPAVIDACNALLDLRAAQMIVDATRAKPAYRAVVTTGQISDDPVLVELSKDLDSVSDQFAADIEVSMVEARGSDTSTAPARDRSASELYQSALVDMDARCQEVRSPGWFAQIALAPLGPEPHVLLAVYGTVTPLADEVPIIDDSRISSSLVRGRNLSPIAVRGDGWGGVVARWTYTGYDDHVMVCEAISHHDGAGSTCGPMAQAAEVHPQIHPRLDLVPPAVAISGLPDSVAFVVLEIAGRTYVQRPAAGMALVRAEGATATPADQFSVRAYDVDGNPVACSPRGDELRSTDC
jgi:hypothetical protein